MYAGYGFRSFQIGDVDVVKHEGIAQIRAWKYNTQGGIEEAFHYEQIQAAHYVSTEDPHPFCLVAYEQYLEFSLNGYVLLTLADYEFERGRVGFYAESAQIRVDNLELKICDQPRTESYPKDLENY